MVKPPGKFFPDVWRSATDFRFYGAVARLPFGLAFRHLLKIALGLGTVFTVVMVVEMIWLNPLLIWFRDNTPVIRILDGVVSADVEQPYTIERTHEGEAVFALIIDTTGATTQLPAEYANAILLKKRGFTLKAGDRTFQQEFSGIEDVTIDGDYFQRLIITRKRLVLYIIAAYGGVLLLLLAQSALIALAGQAIARTRGMRFSYTAMMQMSFYALSLAVCFLVLVILLGVRLNLLYLMGIYLFIHIAFLMGAVMAAGREEST